MVSVLPPTTLARACRVILAAAVVAAVPAPALSDALSDRINSERIVRQRHVDIDIVRTQQRREDFAREQRILREVDRLNVPDLQGQIDVPTVRPTCQNQIRGNTAIGRTCR